MGDVHTMEILQTLGRAVQLSPYFSGGGSQGGGVTYQIQPVGMIIFNILHDVTVVHPF